MKKIITTSFVCLFLFAGSVQSQNSSVKAPEMVRVAGGDFQMGNAAGGSDEKPVHNVHLNSFDIGKFEVTFSEFKKFVDATGYITDAEQPDTVRQKHGLPPRGISNGTWKMYANNIPVPANDSMKPVGNVSWNDAMAYCDWLGKQTGKKFRLPTEAEWEYAARGGNQSKNYTYCGSNDLGDVAWYLDNAEKVSHTVGRKMPNELGIYDMAGNVREWCSDWYTDTYYKTSPAENPAGPERGSRRVLRGGSWGSAKDRMRMTYRNYEFPYNSSWEFGFRVAIPGEPVAPKMVAQAKTNLLDGLDTKGFIDVYGINFDIGKYKVKPESYPIIKQIADYLKEHPQMKIIVEGHTDNTGSDDKNQVLSENRAASIKTEIVKHGIDAGRMETKGYGASKPIADNKTAEGRTQNRRVTIKKQ